VKLSSFNDNDLFLIIVYLNAFLILFLGLHLSAENLKHGAFYKVSQSTITTKASTASRKRMKMNCFQVPARLVLYFLSWSGFLVSFMMRNDINFALVVMVKSRNNTIPSLNGNSTNSTGSSTDVKQTHFTLKVFFLIFLNFNSRLRRQCYRETSWPSLIGAQR
jgi:hypothetical protein